MPSHFTPRQRSLILSGLLLAIFLAAVESTVVATAMPTVIADLGGIAWYGWVGAAYLLTATVTMPIYGRLADARGRKPVLIASIVLFLIGSALSGVAQTMWQLILARALQGLGAGGIQPLCITVVGDLYDLEERARVQAMVGAVWGLAGATGPLLGGFLVSALTWRWVFWFNVPFGLASIAVLVVTFRETKARGGSSAIDWQGALLLAAASSLLLLGAGGTYPGSMLAAALALAVLFVVQERRAEAPLLPLPLLAQRHVAVSSLSSLMLGAAMMGVLTFAPLYAQGVLGKSPTQAGAAVAPMLIGWPLAAGLTSRTLTRVGFRLPVWIGSALLLVGVVILALGIHSHSSVALLWIGNFAMGAGLGATTSTMLIALQTSVPWQQRGVVTASNMFARSMGGSLGMGALGALLALLLRARLSPEEIRGLIDLHGKSMVSPNAGALEEALQPLFWVIVAVAVVNALVIAFFPAKIARRDLEPVALAPEIG